mgnify:CR=1 FL=1
MAKTTKITSSSNPVTDVSNEIGGLEPSLTRRIEHSATIGSDLSGLRFDQIAAKVFSDYSRGKLQAWINSGELTVNGKTAKTRQKIFSGAELRLSAEFIAVTEWQAEDKPIDIVFEDEHLLVINKADNCVVHPAPGLQSGTLVNSVLAHCPDNAALPRGGIVHRLDKDTTGLMMVAKSLIAHTSLVRQLQARTVSRIYRAVVKGTFISGGTVDAAIARHPSARTKMAVANNANSHAAKPAITHYRITERFQYHNELTIKLETGRTHQIRVHMAHLKHPLVGDKTYNPRYQKIAGISETLDNALREFPRQALHAFQLAFDHPVTEQRCEFECEAPADYRQLIQSLRDEAQSRNDE